MFLRCASIVLILVGPLLGQTSPDFFPMSKGTYWIYSGKVKWTLDNSNRTAEKQIQWKMEVIDSWRSGEIEAALLKGHPADLAWYEPNQGPGEYLLARRGTTFFFTPERAKEVFEALRRGRWDVTQDEIFFKVPLAVGKRFCEPDEVQRTDGHYCWIVDSKKEAVLNIAGVPPRPVPQYLLAYFTNPDHELDFIVPGVGITRWVYDHHGTVADVDVRLIEFHLGNPTGETKH